MFVHTVVFKTQKDEIPHQDERALVPGETRSQAAPDGERIDDIMRDERDEGLES